MLNPNSIIPLYVTLLTLNYSKTVKQIILITGNRPTVFN